MMDDAIAAVRAHSMLQQGDRVLAAVSGGADSVALLSFLHTYCEENHNSLGALHLNHRLRGEESERDERFVRELCARMGVPLTVRSADVAAWAAEHRVGLEEAGRACRYRFFEEEAAGQRAKVATAHTLDDHAETVLLNLVRGGSLRGLCGIPPVRGVFIRPLIGCTRAQVERYLRERGQDWVEDSTNAGDDFLRNRIRHRVLPLLEAENPRLLRSLGEMSAGLRADAAYLEAEADRMLKAARDGAGWSRAALRAMPQALRAHALAGLLRRRGIPRSREAVRRMEELTARGSGAVQLCGRLRLRCNARRLFFEEAGAAEPVEFAFPINLAQAQKGLILPLFGTKRLRLHGELVQKSEIIINFPAKQFKNALDCDKMCNTALIRTRRPGDRLRPPGSMHAKTLKNLFQEAGVPPAERRELAVLAGEDGAALWVEGIGPDSAVAVGPETERILVLTVEESNAF